MRSKQEPYQVIQAKLIVVGGDAKVNEINLNLPCTIGRGKGATLTLPHPLVSRQHCEVFEAEGMLMVRDLGSLNGTFVGSERVTESELPPGELLTIGTVTFRAMYHAPGHTPLPPAEPGAETEMTPGNETVRVAAKSSDEAIEVVDFGEVEEEDEAEDVDFFFEDDESDSGPPSTEASISGDKTRPTPSAPPDGPLMPPSKDDSEEDFLEILDEADDDDADTDEGNLSDFLKDM